MKHLIPLFALITLSASSAFAAPSFKLLQSNITSMKLGKGLFIDMEFEGGTISINKKNATAQIILMPKAPPCPTGAICTNMKFPPQVVTLDLVATENDGCGSVHYTAKENKTTADEAESTLEITDNSKHKCETFAMLIPTTAHYSTKFRNRKSGKLVEAEGDFSGDVLKTVVIRARN